MNRISRAMKAIGIVVLVGLISWSIVVASNRVNQDKPTPPPIAVRSPKPTRPAYCVPIPQEAQMSGPPTPTPNRFSTSKSNLSPTVTPIPFAHVYDLSPKLPLSEKSEITVFRCNGEFDQYLAGPDINIHQAIKLKAGDVIISSAPPASLMGIEPPGPITTHVPPVSTSTAFPYPPPSTLIDLTPIPEYPQP